MKLTIIYAAHRLHAHEDQWISTYEQRIKSYDSLKLIRIKDSPKIGQDLQKHIDKKSCLVSLDEKGKTFTTPQFKTWIEKTCETHASLTFFIGGSYGLPKEILELSNHTISLSPFTLPHRLALLVLTEQIYRVLSMIHNHPYHHS